MRGRMLLSAAGVLVMVAIFIMGGLVQVWGQTQIRTHQIRTAEYEGLVMRLEALELYVENCICLSK